MRPVLVLGVRLAWGTPGQRGRSLLVATAAALGTALLLCVVAVAAVERRASTSGYAQAELARLEAVAVLVLVLPVLMLAATVARLSASLRDRRLANLRLLGLSPRHTRLVAAVEAGCSAMLGALVGLSAFVLLRLLLGDAHVAGRPWAVDQLRPGGLRSTVVVLGLPLVVMAVAALPQRLDAKSALDRARRADARRPSPWRALPLVVGIGLSIWSWDIDQRADHGVSNLDVTLLFAGMVLTGLGLVMVIPVFVRLLADLVHRLSPGPATLLAARRMQAQPAAVTRTVSALMIGLFVVTGARAVLVAFESTTQYEDAASNIEQEQRATILSTARRVDDDLSAARSITGVRGVVTFATLQGNPGRTLRDEPAYPTTALVGTCADLARIAPAVTNCVDGEPMQLTSWWVDDAPAQLTLGPQQSRATGRSDRPSITIATPTKTMRGDDDNPERQQLIRPLYADLFVPAGTPGLRPLLLDADRQSVIVAGAGRDLEERLWAAGLHPELSVDLASYDFVDSLRRLVWAVAAVVLGVGLLTFAIAAIDRAIGRRREVISLKLAGVPPRTLRRAQWVEAALPTATGAVLAVGAGLYAGATYLRLDGTSEPPWRQSLVLAGLALIGSALVAGLTVIATNTRIDPDHVRAE